MFEASSSISCSTDTKILHDDLLPIPLLQSCWRWGRAAFQGSAANKACGHDRASSRYFMTPPDCAMFCIQSDAVHVHMNLSCTRICEGRACALYYSHNYALHEYMYICSS